MTARRRQHGHLRWPHLSRAARREFLIFACALLAYQATRALVVGDAMHAVARARRIMDLEAGLGWSLGTSLQAWGATRDWLMDGFGVFYLTGHLTLTAAFLVWVWYRRRNSYPLVRNTLLAANAIALVVYALFPVAPPRLVPGSGVADTLYATGVDLQEGALSALFNPYAAVPSMHVGYALLVGVGLCWLAHAWWLRAVALAYPPLVIVTVLITGNHFLTDALVGAGVVALGLLVALVIRSWMQRRAGAHGGLVAGQG